MTDDDNNRIVLSFVCLTCSSPILNCETIFMLHAHCGTSTSHFTILRASTCGKTMPRIYRGLQTMGLTVGPICQDSLRTTHILGEVMVSSSAISHFFLNLMLTTENDHMLLVIIATLDGITSVTIPVLLKHDNQCLHRRDEATTYLAEEKGGKQSLILKAFLLTKLRNNNFYSTIALINNKHFFILALSLFTRHCNPHVDTILH